MPPRTPITAAVVAWVAVFIAGCSGEQGAKITGVLLEKGQPLVQGEKELVRVSLVSTKKDKDSLKADPGAEFKREDATFTFVGPGLGLVPQGDYKIAVVVRTREGDDRLGGQFSPENTPLTYTVTAEPKQEIVVDIEKKTITRK